MTLEEGAERMTTSVDAVVLNRAAYNDRRRKAVCCMCGVIKKPYCFDESVWCGIKPFCSWTCRKLYLYGPDVENAKVDAPSGAAAERR